MACTVGRTARSLAFIARWILFCLLGSWMPSLSAAQRVDTPMREAQVPYRAVPIGLKNFGSTCYLNSALQFLNAVFAAYGGKLSYPEGATTGESPKVTVESQQRWNWYVEHFATLYAAYSSDVYSPTAYRDILRQNNVLPVGQSDAAKSFENIIAGLCATYPSNSMMVGRTQTMTCSACQSCTIREKKKDPYLELDLSGGRDEKRSYSLYMILSQYYGKHTIQKRCEPCSKTGNINNIEHTLQTRLAGPLPQVLLIKAKVFRREESGKEYRLRLATVERYITVAGFVHPQDGARTGSEQDDSYRYECIGLVLHDGDSIQRGHYRALVKADVGLSKHDDTLGWYECNDSRITPHPDSAVWHADLLNPTSAKNLIYRDPNYTTGYLFAYRRVPPSGSARSMPLPSGAVAPLTQYTTAAPVSSRVSTAPEPYWRWNARVGVYSLLGVVGITVGVSRLLFRGRNEGAVPLMIGAGALGYAFLAGRYGGRRNWSVGV